MKKRACRIAALIIALCCSSAYAASDLVLITYPNNDSVLHISGETGKKGNVSLRVLYLGEEEADFLSEGKDVVTPEEVNNNPGLVDYFNVTKTNTAGDYSFSYKTKGQSGYYLFTVTTADGRQEAVIYEYYSPEFSGEKIKLLNQYIAANDLASVNGFILRYTKPLAAENPYYLTIENEIYISELGNYILSGGVVSDKTDLKQRIKMATIHTCLKHFEADSPNINNTKIEAMLESFSEYQLSQNTLYSKNLKSTVTKETKKSIIESFQDTDAMTDSSFVSQIGDKIFLGAVRYSEWGIVQAVLEDNLSMFSNTTQTQYATLKSKYPAYYAGVAKALAKNQYDSFAALETAFQTAIEKQISDAQNDEQKTQTPHSGGGGGGGGGGSYLPVTPTQTNIDKTETKKTFDDLSQTEWAREAVESLATKGVVSGKAETTFAPNDNITREEFLAIVVRAFDLSDSKAECNFADVQKDAWYYKAVASAYKAGITSGISDETFGIGSNITRQDMCVLAAKAAKISGINLTDGTMSFSDEDAISDYAKTYVASMSQAQIVNGVGSNQFAPHDSATRASAAKIIFELLKLK